MTALPLKSKLSAPDDDKFLEVATAANAEALITGNKQHLPAECCGQIKILSPAEFLEFYHQEEGAR